jgi:hypothetical protein
MSERVRTPMVFRFYYVYDNGTETHVDLEFQGTQEAKRWTETEFNGLKYLRHERLAKKH